MSTERLVIFMMQIVRRSVLMVCDTCAALRNLIVDFAKDCFVRLEHGINTAVTLRWHLAHTLQLIAKNCYIRESECLLQIFIIISFTIIFRPY